MRDILAVTVLLGLAFMPNEALCQDRSKIMEFGKPTQNVTPRYIRETIRPDGKKSVVFGNDKKDNKIVGPHGHVVSSKDKGVEYNRTINGKVLRDKK